MKNDQTLHQPITQWRQRGAQTTSAHLHWCEADPSSSWPAQAASHKGHAPNRGHIFAIFARVSQQTVQSLKTLSEETGPILDCCFYLPVFMSLNDPVHERTCIPCGWSVSRYVNWCKKTSLYRTYLHVRWCSKHLFSARQKNARTPAQARLCDGAAVCLPCKPVKPILQFEFCPRSHQNPRQPMTPS